MVLSPSNGAQEAPENLVLFAEGFFEGAGPALTTILNRAVEVQVARVALAPPSELLGSLGPPWVLIEASYQRGLHGTHRLVMSRAAGVTLAAALVGETYEDDAVRLHPRHAEAIRDSVNQVLGAAGPTLMPLFTRQVAFAPATVRLVDDADTLPAELGPRAKPLWVVQARATGAGGLDVDLALTITEELGREIARLGAAVDAPADAVELHQDDAPPSRIDLILDVTLPIAVELGRARMQIQDILKLAPGSVIELDKSAGDPVDLYINDRPIAKGEVVVIDENFGVRLTSIVTASERIRTLR